MHRILSLCVMALLVAAAGPDPDPSAKTPVPRVVQQVPPDLAEAILGHTIAGPDGKDIGRLVDILVDATGAPQAAVIDFGGFMGVGNRRIAVRWDALHFAPSDPKRAITLDMTSDEIKAAPAYTSSNKPAPVVTPEPAPAAEAAARPDKGDPDKGDPDKGDADKGAATQGTPDQGGPIQGTPKQGTPKQGTTDQDIPDQGTANQGTPTQGTTGQDTANQGTPTQGTTDQGTANPGAPKQGTANQTTPDQGTPAEPSAPQSAGTAAPKRTDTPEAPSAPR